MREALHPQPNECTSIAYPYSGGSENMATPIYVVTVFHEYAARAVCPHRVNFHCPRVHFHKLDTTVQLLTGGQDTASVATGHVSLVTCL